MWKYSQWRVIPTIGWNTSGGTDKGQEELQVSSVVRCLCHYKNRGVGMQELDCLYRSGYTLRLQSCKFPLEIRVVFVLSQCILFWRSTYYAWYVLLCFAVWLWDTEIYVHEGNRKWPFQANSQNFSVWLVCYCDTYACIWLLGEDN